MAQPDRERLIEELIARYRKVLERRLTERPQTLDEIEQTVEEIGQEMERELEQRILDLQHPPTRPRPNQALCSCGAFARYRRTAGRHLVTRHGELTLRRPYYYCAACDQGFAPMDATLGLDGGSTSRQVRLWIARQAAKETFAEAGETLDLFTGVRLSTTTVERIAVAVGGALVAAQRQVAQEHHEGHLPEPPLRPQRLYVGMDGTFTPLRDPWKWDGSLGALHCRYGECKTGVVYEARPGPAGDAGLVRKSYVATLGDVSVFTPLIATLAHQHGHHRAKEVIVLGDGAPWIWQIAASQFPYAIQILDYFHVLERLHLLAEARFGEGTAEAKEWVAAREEELGADRVASALAAIAAWKPRSAAKREVRDAQYQYFVNNAERMRYGSYRKKGYHISSGVVESACGHVVCQRLDQAGMHWSKEAAEAIVCLRAALRSSNPPDLTPYCQMAA